MRSFLDRFRKREPAEVTDEPLADMLVLRCRSARLAGELAAHREQLERDEAVVRIVRERAWLGWDPSRCRVSEDGAIACPTGWPPPMRSAERRAQAIRDASYGLLLPETAKELRDWEEALEGRPNSAIRARDGVVERERLRAAFLAGRDDGYRMSERDAS